MESTILVGHCQATGDVNLPIIHRYLGRYSQSEGRAVRMESLAVHAESLAVHAESWAVPAVIRKQILLRVQPMIPCVQPYNESPLCIALLCIYSRFGSVKEHWCPANLKLLKDRAFFFVI